MNMSTSFRRARLQFATIIFLLIASLFFWDFIALYPVKLFVVLMHELSHSFCAVLTGGSIDHIEIREQIGGVCYTHGGISFLVVSSGYLGSMLFGGIIFLLAQRKGIASIMAWMIGFLTIAVTLLFVRNTFGMLFGIVFGAGLIVLTRFMSKALLETALQYLGAMSCLYALVDVKEDLLTLQPRLTDASILSGMTGVPAIVWGIAWGALALLVFVLIMKKAYTAAWRKS